MSKLFAYLVELNLGTLGWVDVTPDVQGDVTITRGRTSEGNRADPGRCTLRLDNLSGDYSPRDPASAYYGHLGRNTPIRVRARLAADDYSRTLSSGWGTATTGQTWGAVIGAGGTLSATDATVTGGVGKLFVPATNAYRAMWLPTLSALDADVTVTSDTVISTVSGGNIEPVAVLLRMQDIGTYYMARVEINTSEAVTIALYGPSGLLDSTPVPSITWAGQPIRVHAAITGNRLSATVWDPAVAGEPQGWQVQATDTQITTPGGVGLRAGVAAGNTNTLPVEFRFDDLNVSVGRFYGEVATWPPAWNLNGTVRYVDVEASGILRRLGQGEQPKWSPMRRTIAASGPGAYWPLEDGTEAGQGGSALAGVAAATITGAGEFVAIDDLPTAIVGTIRYGTSALLNLAGGGTVTATLPASATGATASAWAVSVAAAVDYAAVSGDVVISEVATPGGTYIKWQLIYRKTTLRMQVVATDTAGTATTVIDSSGVYTTLDTYDFGVWQNGGNISVGLGWYLGSYGLTGSIAGTLTGVTSVTLNATGATQSSKNMPFGHLAVWAAQHTPADEGLTDSYGEFVYGSTSSWRNEAAVDRLARVCAEEGIGLAVTAPAAAFVTRMGWQAPATFAALLDQCADADGGYLYESRDTLGLTFRPRDSLYNQTPVPIAYVGKLAPPFAPVDDADDVRNDVTVKRTGGSSARVVETSGRLAAVPPPGGVGVYRTEVELNLADDFGLADQASWRVHLGTVERERYPSLSVQFASPEWQADPAGLAAVLAVDTGDVLEVTGLPSWAAGDARTLVTGYTEKISEYLWSVTFAGVPAQPWDVAEVDGAARVAMDGGTLAAAVTAGGLTLSLASTPSGGLWTTNPLDFPLDLLVGEERVRVSAISGAASPQTATVSARAVNGVAAAWPAGTDVDVWLPAVVAL